MRHLLQILCLLVAGLALLPLSAAMADSYFQACGLTLQHGNCPDARSVIMLTGVVFASAVAGLAWVSRRKLP